MRQAQPAEILRSHISEADLFRGKPLYEAIVAKCRELKIAGATVLLGLEGYGETVSTMGYCAGYCNIGRVR